MPKMADEGSPAVIPDDDGVGQAGTNAAAPPAPQQMLTVESSDILRLVHHHLTECGLHGAARAVREESGVGAAGVHRSGSLRSWAREGRWADVLRCLGGLDAGRCGLQVRTLAEVVFVEQVVCHADMRVSVLSIYHTSHLLTPYIFSAALRTLLTY